MATTAPATDRAHKAAKRYIYAWGEGSAEGDGNMKDLLGGKGAGLAEMTKAGPPDAARLHDHDRRLQRLLRGGRAAPGRSLGRRPRGGQGGRAAGRQGLRRRLEPAPRQRPLRREVLDAGDDGHRPQPGPERGDAPRADRADRQRAVRLGRVPAVHPDVRPDRHGRRRRAGSTRPSTRRRHERGAKQDTDLSAADLSELGETFKAIVREDTGREFPIGPVRAARPRDQGRVRELVRPARPRLPQVQQDRRRPRDRRQRRDDGLRQHGRRLRDRRRVHPRPEHRRERPVRRVPHERPGRGRRRRHPDRAEDRPDGDRHAGRLRRVPADRPAAREPLPRRPGPRVHDREGPPLHAPDAVGEADRRGRREDRGRHGRGRARSSKEEAVARIEPAHVDQLLRATFDQNALKGATKIVNGLNASPGAAVGRAVFDADTAVEWVEPRREGHPRPDRDLARRLPRHGREPGHHHRPRRRDVARGGRRPPDRQALRRRLAPTSSSTTAASRRTAP